MNHQVDNKIVKHFTQCNLAEKKLIQKKLNNIKSVSGISKHAKNDHQDRLKEEQAKT